jgi:tetratricopeptide (TPR) repeat protein
MAEALRRQLPDSTLVNGVILPTTRGALALAAQRPAEAIAALAEAAAYEAGGVAVLIPRHLRGVAYLRAGEPARALEEFEKIVAQRGADPFSPVCALAPLGIARSLAALGRGGDAARAYDGFLAAWAAADADVPVLLEARQERGRLSAGEAAR